LPGHVGLPHAIANLNGAIKKSVVGQTGNVRVTRPPIGLYRPNYEVPGIG